MEGLYLLISTKNEMFSKYVTLYHMRGDPEVERLKTPVNNNMWGEDGVITPYRLMLRSYLEH